MEKSKIILSTFVLLAAAILICTTLENKKETVYLSASWSYNYQDIQEISQASDLIALVKVNEVSETYVDQNIPFTEFAVSVITPVYNTNNNDMFTIVMTGGETEDEIIEIADDPLLQPGDEILVFCQKNSDGTYKIISGPQGRLVYSDGKLNSLNKVDSRVKEVNPDSNITVENEDADKIISEIKTYMAAK